MAGHQGKHFDQERLGVSELKAAYALGAASRTTSTDEIWKIVRAGEQLAFGRRDDVSAATFMLFGFLVLAPRGAGCDVAGRSR